VTMVTVLVGPSAQSGIALIDASERKNRCSFSYARDCMLNERRHEPDFKSPTTMSNVRFCNFVGTVDLVGRCR